MESKGSLSSVDKAPCSSSSPNTNETKKVSPEETDVCNDSDVLVASSTTVAAADSLASNLDLSLNLDDNSLTTISISSHNNNEVMHNVSNEHTNNISDSIISSSSSISNNNNNEIESFIKPHTTITINNNIPKFGVPVPNRVFVGGIPDDVTDNDVRQLFSQYGNIYSVKIITDRAGISKGYGFVTFEKDEDAQKVIKEADNLIIKNRKLNISTAVMKHQHYPFKPRILHGATFLYPQIPFSNATNYNQFYSENFHGFCPAEGLPLYQIAGMNGHFVSTNPCSSLLTSPVSRAASQYMAQPAAASAAFASYQSPTGFIYPNVSPGQSSIAIPSQYHHPMYAHPAPPSQQHLLSAGAAAIPATASHAFQYSTAAPACNSLAPPNNGNSPGSISSLRGYPTLVTTTNHNPAQSSQMNLSTHQQYIPFSNNVSSGVANNQSMHLSQAHLSSLHPQTLPDIQNSTNTATVSPPQPTVQMGSNGTGTTPSSINPGTTTIMHSHHVPTHHSNQPQYATYPSSHMATVHHPSLTHTNSNNPIQNVHLKAADPTSTQQMEMIHDNVAVPSSLAQISATAVHLANNPGGFLPPHLIVNEMMWSSTATHHVPTPGASFGTSSTISQLNNNLGCNPNNKSHQMMPNNRSSNNNASVSYCNSKSSPPNTNSNAINNPSSAISNQTNQSILPKPSMYNSNSNSGQSQSSSKEKISNSRHSNHNSSYTSSHKKMYNGNNYNASKTNNHNKIMNGGSTNILNNNVRHCNSSSIESSIEQHQNNRQSKSHHSSKSPSCQATSANMNFNRLNHHTLINNCVTTTTTTSNQTLITKTINGVQIYALANNNDTQSQPQPVTVSNSAQVNGGGGSESNHHQAIINNTPPLTPNNSSTSTTITYKS